MRLLHIHPSTLGTLEIALCEFVDDRSRPPYATLSHRWRDGEVSFSDMIDIDASGARKKKGFEKIEGCAYRAIAEGLEYLWVDTCCIDKSSSSELSEAINSMYRCGESSFRDSCWFTRGWTLQELIAPENVAFYSQDWTLLGNKKANSREIALASGVTEEVLTEPGDLKGFCVAEKMAWAARRDSTRAEDEAYCLMGLFGVNMPPLYGEGLESAFRRLQIEIMKISNDHTIFAWNSDAVSGDMLAPSARYFQDSGKYGTINYNSWSGDLEISSPKPDYAMTNAGLQIQLPLLPVPRHFNLFFGLLACKIRDDERMIAIFLRKQRASRFNSFTRVAFNNRSIYPISPNQIPHSWTTHGPEHPVMWINAENTEPWGQLHSQELSVHGDIVRFELNFPADDIIKLREDPPWFGKVQKRGERLYLSGSINTRDFQYRVFRFKDEQRSITVAFGELNGIIWYFADQDVWPESDYMNFCKKFEIVGGEAWDVHQEESTSWKKVWKIRFLKTPLKITSLGTKREIIFQADLESVNPVLSISVQPRL
ncbi:hypothetical protein BCR34DRAFT_114877 [Clohesyomyces aquaticus]|uniref:Heterokaryon incompatibility domain-containing protein n=1 Tax=Clohesyomyces aquaticus TaxID=1231657 RepID=A0A1Y1YQS2_9PLEO|nr:hypothetical protein BCR34DRAFT_114877 [Clohesyomyces aquaticus]